MPDRRRDAIAQRAKYVAQRIQLAQQSDSEFSVRAGITDNGKPARFDQLQDCDQYDITTGGAVSGMVYEDNPNSDG